MPTLTPWSIIVVAIAGWLNQEQAKLAEYLLAENKVLKQHAKGANSPIWQWLDGRCNELGYAATSFNTDFDRHLPKEPGGWLIVTAVNGSLVLPRRYWSDYLPVSPETLERELSEKLAGRIEGKSARGNRVTVLFGQTLEQLKAEIDKLSDK